ncbi:flavin reductase family protein [Holophaga foetida]|uniref:flavin reductase family protein n=1 Tax=Holophaga foetida TaxID=35839 RepID=UPI0002475395|nr:flavin reductase [Holophaga foetida]
MQGFTKCGVEHFHENPFSLIGHQWMLITAGTPEAHNAMTASWGGLGVLWQKNVATIYIRPTRYTLEFVEKHELFTLSFLAPEHRDAHSIFGSESGRHVDKTRKSGFTPVSTEEGGTTFEQAELVIQCRKLYHQDLDPAGFLDPSIEALYPLKDYHRVFVGEIQAIYRRG